MLCISQPMFCNKRCMKQELPPRRCRRRRRRHRHCCYPTLTSSSSYILFPLLLLLFRQHHVQYSNSSLNPHDSNQFRWIMQAQPATVAEERHSGSSGDEYGFDIPVMSAQVRLLAALFFVSHRLIRGSVWSVRRSPGWQLSRITSFY